MFDFLTNGTDDEDEDEAAPPEPGTVTTPQGTHDDEPLSTRGNDPVSDVDDAANRWQDAVENVADDHQDGIENEGGEGGGTIATGSFIADTLPGTVGAHRGFMDVEAEDLLDGAMVVCDVCGYAHLTRTRPRHAETAHCPNCNEDTSHTIQFSATYSLPS